MIRLALASLRSRAVVACLTALSIALSVFLLVAVEKVREGARGSLAASVAGTDLIVGAPTSDVALLLHTVFGIGEPTRPIPADTAERLSRLRQVAWAVPISLGDGHRGDRVVGTVPAYFDHVTDRRRRPLRAALGRVFAQGREVVIGADVAARHGYAPGAAIVLAHGAGALDFSGRHADQPFAVVGVLAPTGTPVDRSLFVPLAALDALHAGESDARIETITAVLVGLRSPRAAFLVQRALNGDESLDVSAVMPGFALARLWSVLGRAEGALMAISWLVVAVSCVALAVAILASLDGRRREMAVLRAAGAGPLDILALLFFEAAIVVAAGLAAGLAAAYGGLALLGPWLETRLSIPFALAPPSPREVGLLAIVAAAALVASALPAWRAYRTSLADGLNVRA